jgi:integrase
MRIPKALVTQFAGLKPRIMKSTEVFPDTKNAVTIVKEMKMMVKELIRERDAKTLKKLQQDQYSLSTLYAKWKTGRLHLAEPHENKPLVKTWREYLDRAVLAEKTRTNRHAVIAALVRKGLISDGDVLAHLPERLAAIRTHYQKAGAHPAFNTYRMEILTFLTKGLGFDDQSHLLHAVARVRTLPPQKRRPHHPFESPRDLAAFCEQILERDTEHAKLYVHSVQFMCMHGLRPDEFAFKRFGVEPKSGHLKINGTKNENADRLVPMHMDSPDFRPPKIDTLNRMFERMQVPVRCRDFRRTYAIWCERAGILQSNIRLYMGHGDTSVTHTYQRIIPSAAMLDADQAKLRKWMDAELKKPRTQREKPSEMSDLVRMRLSGNALKRLVKKVQREEVEDTAFEARIQPGPERRRASSK